MVQRKYSDFLIRSRLPISWREPLGTELEKDYFLQLRQSIAQSEAEGHRILPSPDLVFNAFKMTPFGKVRVVILGQDPYPQVDRADGLAFSIAKAKIDDSLSNIFKNLEKGIPGYKRPNTGDLSPWGRQGVLLLNTTLTVNAGYANSHRKFGWKPFVEATIRNLSLEHTGLVFMLWGKAAQEFENPRKGLIDKDNHLLLRSPHPSPRSAYRGFFTDCHFQRANEYFAKLGRPPIEW